ncbi:MAG: hypothetical protein KA477_01350, partial [Candidatus Levybacteria bacterium]|nr:hypothetical protein [Candidatus Levybacteria bacterium]
SLKHISKDVLGIAYSITDSDMLTYVNKARAENNLQPLVMNDVLAQAALAKGKDMFSKNYWAHFAPDGTSPWYFIRNSGYQYTYAGENLAKGFTDSKDVVDAWLASPSHRENILSDKYQDMGFAILEGSLQGEDTVLVVQMFGKNPYTEAAAVPSENSFAAGQEVAPAIQEPILEKVVEQESGDIASAPQEAGVQAAFEEHSVIAKPLINIAPIARIISIGLVSVLLFAFILDVFVIERKKIPRLVGHNLDHMMLFLLFLIVLITQGIGVIL